MYLKNQKGHKLFTYGPFEVYFYRLRVSHGASAVDYTSATKQSAVLT